MKHVITVLSLAALLVGSAACSSKTKKEETPAPVETASTEITPPVDTTTQPAIEETPSKDLSLGASSSGRGK